MFSINQAGNIKTVNTIDELIIEYIRQYACKCNQNNSSNIDLKEYVKFEHLDEYAKTQDLQAYAKLTNLDEYALKEYVENLIQTRALTTDLLDYVRTEDFTKELMTYLNQTQLEIANAVNGLATEEYVNNAVGNLVSNESLKTTLTSSLEPYAKLTNLNEYALKSELTSIDNKFANYTSTNDLTRDYALKNDIKETVSVLFETNSKSFEKVVDRYTCKYVEFAKFEDEIKSKLGINAIAAYETDEAGFIKLDSKTNKIAIIPEIEDNVFTFKYVQYNVNYGIITLLENTNHHYNRSIQSVCYNNSLKEFNTIDINNLTEIIIDKEFDFDIKNNFRNQKSLITFKSYGLNTSKMTDMNRMFNSCRELVDLDIYSFDTSNVINMEGMFGHCYKLVEFDLSRLDTSKVENMGIMFISCPLLERVKFGKNSTRSVSVMNSMFNGCTSLKSIDVSNIETSRLMSVIEMFAGCNKLEYVNVANWDTRNITTTKNLFSNCSSLKAVNLSNWDVSNIPNMSGMFRGCDKLESINVSNWNTSNATDMSWLFGHCHSINILDLSSFTTESITSINSFAEYTYKLERIDISNIALTDEMNISAIIGSSSVKLIKCKEDTFTRLSVNHTFLESFIRFGDIYVDSTYLVNEQSIIKPLTITNEGIIYESVNDITDITYNDLVVNITNQLSENNSYNIKGFIYESVNNIISFNVVLNDTHNCIRVDDYTINYDSTNKSFKCFNSNEESLKMFGLLILEVKPLSITTQSNTTITHYCPISSNNSINDFVIGTPVYLTGDVYKYDTTVNNFVKSGETDTTDCICSVKTSGSWKEYVGICVRIDEKNNCITFASGGDYMIRVDDSSCYSIGDEVFIDNEDNKLKILAGATAITSKIRRMTVGIITGIINETMLSIFK